MRPIANPPNPFESIHRELLEPASPVSIAVFEDHSREILSRNESPDLDFRWSVNPYRGCFHGCAYCYARPTHEYWGFGAGTDFESKLVVKRNAPALLRQAFSRTTWTGERVVFSGNTDCYQPLEAAYGLTRACLEVCCEFRNPVALITKSTLILRDLALLQDLQRRAWLHVYVSIPFIDPAVARHMEPHVPSPSRRFETLRTLSEAGIATGVSLSPIIPGLNDQDIPSILKQANAAGAGTAFCTLLRLPGAVAAVFEDRLRTAFPARVEKILHRLRDMRNGALNSSQFFERHAGAGEYWDTTQRLFEITRRRLGMRDTAGEIVPQTFCRPGSQQPSLFEEPSA